MNLVKYVMKGICKLCIRLNTLLLTRPDLAPNAQAIIDAKLDLIKWEARLEKLDG